MCACVVPCACVHVWPADLFQVTNFATHSKRLPNPDLDVNVVTGLVSLAARRFAGSHKCRQELCIGRCVCVVLGYCL